MRPRGARRVLLVASHLAVAVVAVLASTWLLDGGQVRYVERSPNRAYSLVTHVPSRLERLRHGGMETPAYAELYRVYDEALLCRSRVVDLSADGQVSWNADAVQVAGIVFRPFGSGRSADCTASARAETIHGDQAPPASLTAPAAPLATASGP